MTDSFRPVQRPLTKFFEKIVTSQSFELAPDFLHEKGWDQFLPEEQQLIVQFFLLAADSAMMENSALSFTFEQIYGCLKAACEIAPKSAKVWFRLGAYLHIQNDASSLLIAISALEKSIAIDNCFFDAHYALASSLLQHGTLENSIDHIVRAVSAFSEGFRLLEEPTSCPPNFLWHWGSALFFIGRDSGEPYDYVEAMNCYKRACELGASQIGLYEDYANCVIGFSLLTRRMEAIREVAIPLYQRAIDVLMERGVSKNQKELMLQKYSMACCYLYLFEAFYEKEDFLQADRSFQSAIEHHPQDSPRFWHKWGQLHFYAGNVYDDVAYIHRAIACFEMAEQCSQKNPIEERILGILYALWAEALLILAKRAKADHLIFEAHEKAKKAFSIQKSKPIGHPDVYAAMGLSLYALGEYFQEKKYYEDALSVLQDGFIAYSTSASIWYAFGTVKFALSEIDESETFLKEAVIACTIASKSVYTKFPFFWTLWGKVLLSFADWAEDALFIKEAIHRFEKALELAETVDSELVFYIATAYSLLGEMEDDEEFFERSIFLFTQLAARSSLEPEMLRQYALTQLYFAEIMEDSDELYKAKILYEEYIAQDIEDDEALIEYALCLMHIGYKKGIENGSPEEWFLAESLLLRSVQIGSSSSYYHLASLYSLMGNRPESIERLYDALEADVLPPPEDILDDIWFSDEMQRTPQFHSFFALYVEMSALAVEAALNDLMQDENSEESGS